MFAQVGQAQTPPSMPPTARAIKSRKVLFSTVGSRMTRRGSRSIRSSISGRPRRTRAQPSPNGPRSGSSTRRHALLRRRAVGSRSLGSDRIGCAPRLTTRRQRQLPHRSGYVSRSAEWLHLRDQPRGSRVRRAGHRRRQQQSVRRRRGRRGWRRRSPAVRIWRRLQPELGWRMGSSDGNARHRAGPRSSPSRFARCATNQARAASGASISSARFGGARRPPTGRRCRSSSI